MINKKLVKKGATLALALAIAVPALTPAAAAAKADITIEAVKFNEMEAPKTIDEMVKTYTKATVDVKYSNGEVKTFPLSYNYLFKSEDKVAIVKGEKVPAGTPIDVNGNPIKDPSSTDGKYFVSDSPDSNSLLMPIDGKLYMVTHYEYQTIDADGQSAYGLVPASMSLTEMEQDKKTGELKPVKVEKIDFSAVDGLWIPCNGSLSPWNTHLGSEEYEPDARQFLDVTSKTRNQVETFAQYYFGDKAKANPYFYGFTPEITVDKNGKTSVVKHYSTGRISHELAKVMPDNKTVFFGDDGGNTGLFMYVADKERDLSSGILYAAKFNQTGTENGGSGDLQWINLGHTTDAEVKDIIDSDITFNDIFETSDAPKEGFTAIKQYSYGGKVEYLKLKPGKEKAAAFLETRRYAAMLGATTEFNKMEGVTLNAKDSKAYIAMSYQEKSMEKDTTGKEPADHIQLPKIKAGVTFELDLKNGQKDNTGVAINSSYVASSMSGLVVGEDLKETDSFGNTANPDKVANPDNLSYSEAMRTLFIGEDSGMHTNNYVWAYNVDTKKLDRILSTPAGAEATGLFAADDRNGFSYIFSNFQHPGDELDGKSITAVNKEDLLKAIDKEIGINKTGGIGYISGLPSLTKIPDSSKTFGDVNNGASWAEEFIEKLASKGIIYGKSETKYEPNTSMTRGEFAALISRSLALTPKGEWTGPFKDVPSQMAVNKNGEIGAAWEAGIIQGKTKDTFAPNAEITRAEAAAMVGRAMNYVTFDAGKLKTSKKITTYQDKASIPAWASKDIEKMLQADIMIGDANGKFNPYDPTTRAEMAKIIVKFMEFVEMMD
ncbi:S-layer homology domain-containing protein [Domibacillus mangrovi]|uniref:Alkaline phosphatase n=1 Tax=Domibacillus mangrovi TaxID=1714354 RepID=A0A1Q5P591_9BACI|nr:S-layer homology domain-containing protein [Domibacillus mangrovi]OKL37440.1 alkaline phosphatase [Domibacillus mangrovi]